MPDYKQSILNELHKIEQEEQVRILFACESGSRAWGFPSKDSDYDVRFLYIRQPCWYLSIFDKRDVIERPISNMLDINGWDLKKALQLFRKSNPPLLEWLHSPIQYEEKYSLAEQLRQLSKQAFSPKSCMYHYLNMAKGNYRDYLTGDKVRIKKYFYVLRPVLACSWVEKFDTMPPVEFERMVEALVPVGSELKSTIENLLARKKAGDELDYEPRIETINAYVEERIQYFDVMTGMIGQKRVQIDEQLDALFLCALEEVWSFAKN
ncbi:nucleotidyltransferase domain-containing protein [Brevibacillus reuszeri]|uniref:nucleotidyltransferase domain-containing protein n=1 Tax=Brevibacillus reuszeri TaxID=54915 RepID=UPI002899DBC3|nr:nucleotidyltransferase domain-containing protein [Brevibacillus reuszeri]